MRYKGKDKDIKEIGKDLDVTTILEGNVRKEADDIRVTVYLVNVEDRSQIWADSPFPTGLPHLLRKEV